MSSFAAIAEHFLQELAPISYAASGAISLAPQRARLNSAAGALAMTIAAPGTSLLPGQALLIVFEDATNASTVAYPTAGGTRTRTLSTVGEAILLIALDASRYIEVLGSAQGSAFTQTYATADRTVAAVTYAEPATTVGAALGAFTDPPSAGEMAALRTFVNALKTDDAAIKTALAADAADLLADKKNLNAVIDDLQTRGISG